MSRDPARRIADELGRRGLTAPARLLLDAHLPLAPLLSDAGAALTSWDRAEFWEQVAESPARVTRRTRRVIDAWLDLALKGDPNRLSRSDTARARILDRERALKGSRARLTNPEALRSWGGDSGPRRLDYRWDDVKQIVGDILASQEDEDTSA